MARGRKPGQAYTDKQRAVWLHNSHVGCCVMMQKQASAIMASSTASDTAKRTAEIVHSFAKRLEQELRSERIDPK